MFSREWPSPGGAVSRWGRPPEGVPLGMARKAQPFRRKGVPVIPSPDGKNAFPLGKAWPHPFPSAFYFGRMGVCFDAEAFSANGRPPVGVGDFCLSRGEILPISPGGGERGF